MSFLNNEFEIKGEKEIPRVKIVFPTKEKAEQMLVGEILAPLVEDGGVVFENTPSIISNFSSAYTNIDIPHGNYDYHAFNKASVTELTITFYLTATTKAEADKALATYHFFRTFGKMNFGINDENRGLPPQIFRFSGYGEYMFNRVPVAIRSFNMPFGEDVDFVQTSHGTAFPSFANCTLSLNMMPSPNKVRSEFSLDGFARGDVVKKGYI